MTGDFESANGITEGDALSRRRLNAQGLEGFYNTLDKIALTLNASGTCVPELPEMPSVMVGYSRCLVQ